jgi:hypothetical protein
LTLIAFGFDERRFYLRVDGARPLKDLLSDGYSVSVTFLKPEGRRVLVRHADGDAGRVSPTLWVRNALTGAWADHSRLSAGGLEAAAGTVLELAVPLADLWRPQGVAGDAVALFVAMTDRDGAELERHPPFRPIEAAVPDAWFEARNWSA